MNEYLKVWLKRPNGNGVYLTNDLKVVVIYNDGWNSDYIIDYCDDISTIDDYKHDRSFDERFGINGSKKYLQRFGSDIQHSKTVNNAIIKALDYKLEY